MQRKEWIALIRKQLQGTISPEEAERLEAVFQDLQKQEGNWPDELKGAEADIEETIYRRIQAGNSARAGQPRYRVRRWLQAAALLAGMAFLGTAAYQHFFQKKDAVTAVYVFAAYGHPVSLQLPDSTRVVLNAGGILKYPRSFDKKERKIYLEGEALFEVVSDPRKPFTVHTDTLQTRVLGTSFNLKAYPGEALEVSVLHGKVSVSDPNGLQVVLSRNEQVRYQEHAGFSAVSATDPEEPVSWTRGELNLNNKTLKEAAGILEKYYGISIRFESPELENCEMMGTYENTSLEDILEMLRFAFGIETIRKAETVVIAGSGC